MCVCARIHVCMCCMAFAYIAIYVHNIIQFVQLICLTLILQLYNLQISPYSASPRLSDRTTFKTFVRLVPPENEIAPGIVAVMNAFDWRHLAIITEEHELFTLVCRCVCLMVMDS